MTNKTIVRLVVLLLISTVLMGCTGGVFTPRVGSVEGYVFYDRDTGKISTFRDNDYSWSPLKGAYVKILGNNSFDTTAIDGRFILTNVPAGTRTLQVTHPNYSPFEIKVHVGDGEMTQMSDIGRVHYLIIGVEKFEYISDPAANAVQNAKLVASTLSNNNQYSYKIRTLYNEQAKKTAIRNEILNINASARREDHLVIYYSGRGGGHDLDFGDHIYPYDADEYGTRDTPPYMITDVDLNIWLSGFPGRGVTVILEAGGSGSFADGRGRDVTPLALEKRNYTLLASAETGQPSIYDSGEAAVFTGYLIDGLSVDRRIVDRNNDYTITARELHRYTSEKMQEYFRRYPDPNPPTPKLWNGPLDETIIFRY